MEMRLEGDRIRLDDAIDGSVFMGRFIMEILNRSMMKKF